MKLRNSQKWKLITTKDQILAARHRYLRSCLSHHKPVCLKIITTVKLNAPLLTISTAKLKFQHQTLTLFSDKLLQQGKISWKKNALRPSETIQFQISVHQKDYKNNQKKHKIYLVMFTKGYRVRMFQLSTKSTLKKWLCSHKTCSTIILSICISPARLLVQIDWSRSLKSDRGKMTIILSKKLSRIDF